MTGHGSCRCCPHYDGMLCNETCPLYPEFERIEARKAIWNRIIGWILLLAGAVGWFMLGGRAP